MSRREKGSGYLKQLEDGRYRGYVTLKEPNGRSFKKWFTASSLTEATDTRNRLIFEHRSGAVNRPQTITMSSFLTDWLEKEMKAQIEYPTYRSYKGVVTNHLIPHIGTMRLTSFDTGDIRQLMACLSEKELGTRTKELVYAVLRSSLNHAIELGLIIKNPCTKKVAPKSKKKSLEIPNDDDIVRILNAAQSDPFYALYVLAIHTGMRQGEIFALKWSDINFNLSKIVVRHSAQPVKGAINIKAPKSKAGLRTIDIDKTTCKALRQHQATLSPKQIASGLVFPDSEGNVLRQSNFQRRNYKPLVLAAGATYRGFHGFRHYHATALLDQGTPIRAVQERLGHESPETTIRIYGHVTRKGQEAAAANFERHLIAVRDDQQAPQLMAIGIG